MKHEIKIRRVYEDPTPDDSYKILVDRLWPRGFSKVSAYWDEWCKDLGPSNELRKSFGHIPEKFEDFRKKYLTELSLKADEIRRIRKIAATRPVVLLYSAKDTEHNQAVVLKELLEHID